MTGNNEAQHPPTSAQGETKADTPRVDAALEWAHWNGQDVQMVPYDFARQLERELAEARTELGVARGHAMMAESASRAMADKLDAPVSASGTTYIPE